MANPAAIPDEWSQQDAVKLRTFLNDNPRVLRKLWSMRPKIEGQTMEARAVTGSDLNGFFICWDALDQMQQDPPRSDNAGHIDS